jgi:hypothetical protein
VIAAGGDPHARDLDRKVAARRRDELQVRVEPETAVVIPDKHRAGTVEDADAAVGE